MLEEWIEGGPLPPPKLSPNQERLQRFRLPEARTPLEPSEKHWILPRADGTYIRIRKIREGLFRLDSQVLINETPKWVLCIWKSDSLERAKEAAEKHRNSGF